jgi:Kef-type K+ transport system membrane component KefB
MRSRAWIYPVLVGLFVAVIAVTLQVGERRFAGRLSEARASGPAANVATVSGGTASAPAAATSADTATATGQTNAASASATPTSVTPANPVPASATPVSAASSNAAPAGAAKAAAAKEAGQTPWAVWTANASHPLARLILQIIVIVVAARIFGAGARALGQPPVIGEIAAGIALGPSLLGAWMPVWSGVLFPPASLGILQLLSQVGVILFMFVVGLELDWAMVRSKAHAAVAVSHVSILFPFLLGVLLAFPLYTEHAPAGVSFQAFGLFMGIAMSITAFPVLARILDDRGLSKTSIGSTAITCAAVDDATAWTLLAFVVAVVTSGGAWAILGATLGMATVYALLMVFVVRPVVRSLLAPKVGTTDLFSKERIAIVVGVVFGSALATEVIGVHALFGAFVAGAIMPIDEDFRRGLRERLESFSAVFLLPLFFAFTGLRTQIGLMNDVGAWLTCGAIILLATVGKFGGSAVTARLMGLDWNSSFILGALMNTRGLMELIALNVGYDLGVITPEMFTALVLMALVTTSFTGPLVDLALARRRGDDELLTVAATRPR